MTDTESPIDDSPLRDVMQRHGIELPKSKTRLLFRYCNLLWEWNEKINLTRHTDFEKFVTRDLLDTMRLADLLQRGEHVLDVGSGGGVPGVVLAVIRPDLNVELCDSTGKKTLVLAEIVDKLSLKVSVWNAKAENLLKVNKYTTLLIRAVARMPKLLDWFAPHWQSFDRMLLIKGPSWLDERGESRHYNKLAKLALRKLAAYPIPDSENESVILQICQNDKLSTMEKIIEEHIKSSPVIGVSNKTEAKPNKKKKFTPRKKQTTKRLKGDVKTKGDIKREAKAKQNSRRGR
ncbi:MAG: 16S rRNA (guanine(527)-N(7))-methyltransferase RsmG [Planctomycetaceae bacterium]|jgi:16S rRNA (guanine527-N7)-methyltransferase|nr:16S rRNA (guanine(527)-N(7))-methyltransferase RsmG [Planctomycetaceae bacterium]